MVLPIVPIILVIKDTSQDVSEIAGDVFWAISCRRIASPALNIKFQATVTVARLSLVKLGLFIAQGQ